MEDMTSELRKNGDLGKAESSSALGQTLYEELVVSVLEGEANNRVEEGG